MSFDLKWILNPVQNHYADFEGRATRREFWMYALYYIGAAIVISIIGEVLRMHYVDELFMLVLLLPSLAIGARRLHDTGKTGWWQLLSLIPIAGSIILIILFIQKGAEGDNDYGAAPLKTATTGADTATDVAATAVPSASETEAPVEEKKEAEKTE